MSGALALALLAAFYGIVFGARELLQRRDCGRSSWVAVDGKPPVERTADAFFALGTAMVVASPLLVVTGVVAPAFAGTASGAVGVALVVAATAFAWSAQHAMGSEWRTGVAEGVSVILVVTGPFAVVRNPVYSALLAATTGAALVAPTVLAVVGIAVLTTGLQLQTRAVEEPHLDRVHADRYRRYAARVGRFVPGVGRLREPVSAAPAVDAPRGGPPRT